MPRNIFIMFFIIMFFFVSCSSFDIKDTAMKTTTPEYDVVVIGAGGGGLSAAARLSLSGKKVLVIEQHDKVGGYMTTFEREPYMFEVSLHAFDGLDPGEFNHTMFEKLDIMDKVKPIRLDPMYKSLYPDFTLDVPADPEAYITLLKEKFPHETDGIDRLYKTLDNINRAMQSAMYFAYGQYGKGLLSSVKQFWVFFTLHKYWDVTLTEILDDHIKDEKVKAVFSQLTGFLGAGPDKISGMVFAAMWNSYHRGGYYYFEGGSQSVSDALATVIEDNGGKILLSSLVTKIIIKDGKARAVQTKDGKVFECRYVVSNANVPDTFFKLIGSEHLPKEYLDNIKKLKPGISCFMVYMGVDHDYSKFFSGGTHELLYNVGYDQVENYGYIREGNMEKMPFAIANYSMVDPFASPKGKNVICITTVMPYDWKNGWYEDESYDKYDALKEEMAEIIIKRAEKILPGLSSHIEVMEIGSPRTMEHYTLNPAGSILGWDNTPDQTMMNRLPQETPIDNLYLAGAWTFPSGGQSAVMLSGFMAAEKILKRE